MALLLRGILAIFLTAVVSAFVGALLISTFAAVGTGQMNLSGDIMTLVFVIWLAGMIVAAIAATVLAIFVEWPKSIALVRTRKGKGTHTLTSILGGAGLAYLWILATAPANDFSVDLTLQPPENTPMENILYLFLGAIGGLCSAIVWWLVVIEPLRRARLNEGEA